MKVEVIQLDGTHLATLEMEPSELPRKGEYIHVDGVLSNSFGRIVRHVSRYYFDGKIVSATLLMED